MKSLLRILGLTFLALTLTNCSGQLSSAKIASLLEPSIVRLFYRNPNAGHGTGFFVRGEKGVCTVLTAAHVVKREGERLLKTQDGKVWQVAKVEIFPSDIDLALVTFPAVGEKCNYPALKIGNSENLKKGSLIFIDGFPIRGGKLVSQFVSGEVSSLDSLARGYGVSYEVLTVGGMSGAPVMDVRGEVVAVHGMSDVEVVQSFASVQGSLSESEREIFQQAMERVNGVQSLTFGWGIPINFFRESDFYYADISGLNLWVLFCGGAMFGGGVVFVGLRYFQTPQVSAQRERELERRVNTQTHRQRELEKQLQNERRKRQEVEVQIESLQVAVQRQGELERRLKDEQLRRQEVEGRLKSVQNSQSQKQREVEREGEVKSQQGKPLSSVDVPLVSAKGVDYTKLRDLLAGGKWKEADEETATVMLKVAGRESEGYLRVEDIENFPCQDLGTIDKLWVKYSNGKFGFSVQKQIYQGLGGTKEYDSEVWKAFGDKVGWRQGGKWLSKTTVTFSSTQGGHLPTVLGVGGFRIGWGVLGTSLLSRRDL
ncbi:MAG: GUN4 domain-containing protein [Cyanobacteria bacterium P01_H01_bin.35]